MSDFNTGGDHGPVYVDLYGTTARLQAQAGKNKRHNGGHGFDPKGFDGPFWKLGLAGRLPLWVAFWGGFFFGHGILIVGVITVVMVAVIFGLAVDPTNMGQRIGAAWIILAGVGGLTVVFILWSVITVWRCAPNADERKWTVLARTAVTAYVALWSAYLWSAFV